MNLFPRVSLSLGVFVAALLVGAWLRSPLEAPEIQRWGFGSDSDVYWDLSGNVLAGSGYVSSPGLHPVMRSWTFSLPNISTAPGYPAALAVARRFCDGKAAAAALQALFYIGLVLLVAFWPGLPRWPSWAWRAAVLLVGLWPGFILQLQSISSELMAAFTITLWVWCLWRSPDAQTRLRPGLALLAALAGAAAVATRANLIAFAVFLVAFWLMENRVALRRTPWTAWAISIAAMAAIYTGWAYRNRQLCGEWTFSAYAGQVMRLHYVENRWNRGIVVPLASSEAREQFIRDEHAKGIRWSAAERNLYNELARTSRRFALDHPTRAAWAVVAGFAGFFGDSYFRLTDLVWGRLTGISLVDGRRWPADDLRAGPFQRGAYWCLRVISLLWRIALMLGFLLAVLTLHPGPWRALARALLAFLVVTAFVSSTGDRQLLPVAPLVLLVVVAAVVNRLMPQFQHQQRP